MPRLIDLSHPIRAGMPVWPGDPEVTIEPAAAVSTHGYNLARLHLGSQTGTHVDAPFHVDDALPTLDRIPLERFCGPGRLVDLRGHVGAIGAAHLPPMEPGDVLLLHTGTSARWDTPGYAEHPWLDEAAARAIVAAGVRTVGIDAPSVDRPGDAALPAHHVLAAAHAVIVENLTNLDALPAPDAAGEPVTVWLLPLPLAGTDGAPVRAVAVC